MLNCQLSSSVIFRQYGVSQSECKIDRPRPGLSRLCPRPHTKALGTRLPWILIGRITCHIWPRIARVNWSCYLSHSAHACPSDVIYLHANYFQSQVTSLGASLWTPGWWVLLLGKDNTSQNNLVQIMSLYILYRRVFASVQEVLGHDRGRDVIQSYWQYRLKADFQSSHEAPPRSSLRVMHEYFHPITKKLRANCVGTSDQLSWKWRQQTSKSAIFLASLRWLNEV
jgi:hypothetical protein